MRFMGVIGIVLFIGIAYMFSNNKKAINWYTVFWGLALQILLALAILGNLTTSFMAAAVLLSLLVLYTSVQRFVPWIKSNRVLPLSNVSPVIIGVLSCLKFGLLPVAIGYFLGNAHQSTINLIVQILWILVILIWLARKLPKLAPLLQAPLNTSFIIFAFGLNFGLSLILAQTTNGEQGTLSGYIQELSISVGNFLTIPTNAGASMIFGSLATIQEPWYFLFFVQVLPTIIFFSAFISVLYYLGIIQVIIQEIALFMRWTMKTSGAETLSCSGNIFVGQTEAPILIKPFLKDMTNSEIHAVMTGGFATIAGGVFAGLVAMGIDAGFLISASVMSAPAALMLSKIFYPETERSKTEGDVKIPNVKIADNIIGAAAQGTGDGLQLALNVGAMLLAFIALIKVIDMGLGLFNEALSLNAIFGSIFQYVAYILGVSPEDSKAVGALLGNKITINEFVAFGNLAELISGNQISLRSQAIATYALCGFANFSSIGIQIGGIVPMAPERKADITRLGFSAMWAGAFASWMTAAIAGMFIV